MAAESFSFILSMISMVVMVRLLMPEQFGLISMATAFTGLAEMFKDLGLSDATIQRKKITQEQVSTLFWINLSIGIMIMLIVAAVSPAISWFYGEQRLTLILLALSSSFFFSGLTVQHQALLRRQMRFVQLGWIKILSTALSIAIGISMALHGFEYWSLICKEVFRTVFIAAGTWLMCRWWPGLPERGSGVGSMLRFGRNITGFNIINYFSRNLDNILIGRFWGAGPLGLYDRAYKLMMMPINQLRIPLTNVGMSALSALQNDPDKYSLYYKKFLSILSFVTMPLMMYLGIFSKNFILLLFGEKWIYAADIFRILAITAFIQPIASTRGLVMISCDKTERYVMWGIMNAVCMISAFSIGVYWGPVGVAVAYCIANYAILIPSLWYCFKDTPVSISLFFQSIWLPALTSLIMGFLLILISQKMSLSSNFSEIVFSLIMAIFVYCGVWWLFPGGKQKLIEYCSYPFVFFKK